MAPFYYVLTLSFLFGTILIVFGMKYLSAAMQARAKARADGEYRAIAERAAAAQSESAANLAAMKSELSTIGTRLAAVEKMLKDVG